MFQTLGAFCQFTVKFLSLRQWAILPAITTVTLQRLFLGIEFFAYRVVAIDETRQRSKRTPHDLMETKGCFYSAISRLYPDRAMRLCTVGGAVCIKYNKTRYCGLKV
jgi:hypothetical protein